MPKTSPTVGLPDVMTPAARTVIDGHGDTVLVDDVPRESRGVHSGQVLHVEAEDLCGGAVDGQHVAEAVLDEHAFTERLDDTAVVVAAPQQIGVRLRCRLDRRRLAAKQPSRCRWR